MCLREERDGVGGDLLRRIADPAGCRAIASALDVEPERPAEGQRPRGQRHRLVAQLQLVPGCEAEHDVVVRLLDLLDQLAGIHPCRDARDLRIAPDRTRSADRLQLRLPARVSGTSPSWSCTVMRRPPPDASSAICSHFGVSLLDKRPLQLAVVRHGVQGTPAIGQNGCILRSKRPHPSGQTLVDRGPMALDNGALDHPPSHKEGKYR